MDWKREMLRRLRDITREVELLDHGVCELEARQLAILSKSVTSPETRADVNFLTAMNNNTADAIQKALREIEDIIRTEMENVPEAKAVTREFIQVLRCSLRVLNENRFIQQAYVDELNRRASTSPIFIKLLANQDQDKDQPPKLIQRKKKEQRSKQQTEVKWVRSVFRKICLC